MKSKGPQHRYSRLITVILGLGLVQIFVFMPIEKGLVDMASMGSRQTFLIMEPEEALITGTRDSYFRSTDIATPLSNEINFGIDTTDLTLLYLHVGKTGGMSLDRILRSNCKWRRGKDPRTKCYNELLAGDDELLLSQKTKATLHMDLPVSEAVRRLYHSQELLWTLRNPISRMVSALDMRANHVYVKMDDFLGTIFYEKCGFQTAQAIADELEFGKNHTVIEIEEPESQEIVDVICYELAKGTLEGDRGYGYMGVGQAKYNYAWYLQVAQVLPKSKNFAFRTEHLWDDVIQTEELLVANSNTSESSISNDWIANVKNISSHKMTHGSENYQTKSKLTQRGKEIFCCYLSDENAIYERVMLSAINLSDKQKAESLEPLYRDCGILPPDESVSLVGGFQWQEWREDGCPTQTMSSDLWMEDSASSIDQQRSVKKRKYRQKPEQKRKIRGSFEENTKVFSQPISQQ